MSLLACAIEHQHVGPTTASPSSSVAVTPYLPANSCARSSRRFVHHDSSTVRRPNGSGQRSRPRPSCLRPGRRRVVLAACSSEVPRYRTTPGLSPRAAPRCRCTGPPGTPCTASAGASVGDEIKPGIEARPRPGVLDPFGGPVQHRKRASPGRRPSRISPWPTPNSTNSKRPYGSSLCLNRSIERRMLMPVSYRPITAMRWARIGFDEVLGALQPPVEGMAQNPSATTSCGHRARPGASNRPADTRP